MRLRFAPFVPFRSFQLFSTRSGTIGGLCLSKISKCLSGWRLFLFHNSRRCADAHFFRDTSRNSILDLPFACRPPARELGSAPPNRRASEVRKETPEIDFGRSPVVDLSVPPLA